MTQTSDQSISLPAPLTPIYAPISDDLARAESVLRDALRSEHPFVDQLVRHGFQLGGKRLRPALVLLSGKACGELREDHFRLAAAVEIIHTATLVHDDVLDEAVIRRHIDTINARWNNEASVLAGDYLLAQSLCLASESNDPFAVREIAQGCRIMVEGELRQVGGRGDIDLGEDEYYRIIGGKTAALLKTSCRLGVHFAGGDERRLEALGTFGEELGLAFQIVDDILDLVGDERTVGKSLGTDAAKHKMTLPLIRWVESATDAQREELASLLGETDDAVDSNGDGDPRRAAIHRLLKDSDAVESARATAEEHVDRALDLLDDAIPPSPARDGLEGLARFVLRRKL